MPPTFWVEIEMEGGMGCYRGLTGGGIKEAVDNIRYVVVIWCMKEEGGRGRKDRIG